MEPLQIYALLLIFYGLTGAVQGAGTASVKATSAGKVAPQLVPCLLALVAMAYGFLGLGSIKYGSALYIYLPILLIWWAGLSLGKNMWSRELWFHALLAVCMLVAVLLYHCVL
jgi:hypothetical protein